MKTSAALLLVAVAIAASAAGGALAGPEVDQLTLSRGLFAPLGDRPCRATCEGQPLPEGPNQECFGLLKVFCGPPPVAPGEPPKHELMGAACQGHWKSVAVEVPAGAASAPSLVTVCEGEHRWISLQTSTCSHSNHTTKKMMGLLSLGEIITVMSVSGEEAALLAPHVRRDEAATRQAQEVLQELERRHLPRSAAPTTTRAALKEEGTRTFAFESKHHGFRVDWQATKRVPPSGGGAPAPAEEETFESLEDQAKDAIAPSWRDWLPSGPPPPEHHGANDTFELLCNGKPAWLHGAVPCHGNFTVAGTQTWGPGSAASAAPKRSSCKGRHGAKGMMMGGRHHAHEQHRSSALRRLQATPVHLGDASSSMRPAVELPAQQQQQQQQAQAQGTPHAAVGAGVGHRFSMKSECDGLWTGILGHTCFGVSTSHVEVAEEPVGKDAKRAAAAAAATASGKQQALKDEDDVRALTKWSVCTGHQGIRFVHHDFTSGMAVSCKGGSVMSLSLTVPWRP